jgi:mRNA interferase MazF
VERGEIWWADLGEPEGSEPGIRRPMLIVQSNGFNLSRISTTIAVVMTSNLRRAEAPGNVFVPASDSGLPKDSVANVSQVVTLNKSAFVERAGKLGPRYMRAINEGLKLVLLG